MARGECSEFDDCDDEVNNLKRKAKKEKRESWHPHNRVVVPLLRSKLTYAMLPAGVHMGVFTCLLRAGVQ